MESTHHFIKGFVLVISCFIGVMLIAALLMYQHNQEQSQFVAKKIPVAICGNVSESFSVFQEKGKYIFQANCAACHKKNKRATGPALVGAINKFPDTLAFYNFIQNERGLKGKNRLDATRLDSIYYLEYDHVFNISNEELKSLLYYLEN